MSSSDDRSSALGDFKEKLRRLAEDEHVDFAELFPPDFMMRHTAYAALEDMLEASGLLARTPEDAVTTLHSEGWDTFVSQATEFESWPEMQRAAAAEWNAARNAG